MENKKYSSYEQIESELKILDLEKQLSFQKLIWNVQKVKENLSPPAIFEEVIDSYKSMFSNSYKSILMTIIPMIINFLSNKKRGN
jgi:hypothetical protein